MTETSSNYEKYQTGNPLVRRLIDRFFTRLESVVEPLEARSILDAGCGEGETLARLNGALPDRVAAIDLSADAVEFTAERLPPAQVAQASVYELPFEDDSFDLVLCLEVLEHLEHPERALAELARVGRRDIVLSVPHEPWFRLGTLLRGKYVRALGNHPEHVNHWNRRSLAQMLDQRLELVAVEGAFPWVIAHCQPPAATP